jgi:hypothetical protein
MDLNGHLNSNTSFVNTLAARGLEELFFSCAVVSVFGSGGNWVLVLHTCVLRVQYSCNIVLVFWFWQEIVFGVTYVLSVQYSCAVVSVFCRVGSHIRLQNETPG